MQLNPINLGVRGFTLVSAIIIVLTIGISLWAILALSGTLLRQKKIISTEEEMREIAEALLLFYRDLDVFPYDSGDASVDLKDLEEQPTTSRFAHTTDASLQVWRRNHWDGPYITDYYNDDGYTRDEWNTIYKYDYSKIQNSDLWSDICTLTSAGPDRTFGTGDDIVMNISAAKIRREKIERVKEELAIINAAAKELLSRITTAGKTLTDVFGRNWLEIGDLYATYGASTTGLVGWWKMDESSWNGTTDEVVDSSGNANHGTSFGGANTVNYGKIVRAGSFDGINDYIRIQASSTLNLSDTEGTFIAWIKPEFDYDDNRNHFIFDWYIDSDEWIRIFKTNTTNKLRYLHYGGSGYWKGYDHDISSDWKGKWHFVAMTWNTNTTQKISYYEGVAVNTQSGINKPSASATYLYIGATPSWQFKGLIDEVRIFNRALTENDIFQEYLRGEYLTDWSYRYDEWENEYKWDSIDQEFYSYGPNRVDNERTDSDDDDIYQTKAYWAGDTIP